MNKVENSKSKAYYKTAEYHISQTPNIKVIKNSEDGQSYKGGGIYDLVPSIDIAKMILIDDLSSKDNSPLPKLSDRKPSSKDDNEPQTLIVKLNDMKEP